MELGGRLQEKWGALPVWAWGAIVAGVALVAYFIFNRSGSGTSHASAGTQLDGMGYQTSGIQGGSATPPVPVMDSNLAWLNRASKSVAAAMSASPTEVYAALQKWLSGQDITDKERQYADQAVHLHMSPPDGTTGTSTVLPGAPAAPNRTVVNYWYYGGEYAEVYSDRTKRIVPASVVKDMSNNPLWKKTHGAVPVLDYVWRLYPTVGA